LVEEVDYCPKSPTRAQLTDKMEISIGQSHWLWSIRQQSSTLHWSICQDLCGYCLKRCMSWGISQHKWHVYNPPDRTG